MKGIVIDEDGIPLPGANIVVKGAKQGTMSDIDGKFEIELRKKEIMIVSFVGLENTETKIDSKDFYKIIMQKYNPPMSRKMKRYVRKHGGVVPEF